MYDFFNDPTQLAPAKVLYEARADGSFVLSSPEPLQPYARCIGQVARTLGRADTGSVPTWPSGAAPAGSA
ncbi:MAG: hypothetical protein LKM38_28440 [Pseudomonas veronii]|jgi:hypothetical protein|nr:hypothetical protein [Pseudomonas veronii]